MKTQKPQISRDALWTCYGALLCHATRNMATARFELSRGQKLHLSTVRFLRDDCQAVRELGCVRVADFIRSVVKLSTQGNP